MDTGAGNKNQKEKVVKGISGRWHTATLKEKFGGFALMVIITITAAVLVNWVVVNYALQGFGEILDDNVQCYKFQEAISAESVSFENYVRNRTPDNREEYEAACEESEYQLMELPYSYEETGKERYALTWSIHNAYEFYAEAREQVLQMDPAGQGYIAALYDVYKMQSYLQQYGGKLTQLTLEESNLKYLQKMPLVNRIPAVLAVLGIVLVYAVFSLTRLMRQSVVSPVELLAQASKKIALNDFSDPDLAVENRDEIGELVSAFNKMKHATEGYIQTLEEKQQMAERLHKEEMERVEMEKTLEATRMEMLKSQINPHFLFNTLNTIACMARLEDADTTERMITSMSNLFRYNLKTTEPQVTLSRELKIVDDYLYIQQTRFGDRIRYRKEIEVNENQVIIPSLSLQPIVENAIIHGLSQKEQGGEIYIRVWEQENVVVIQVNDSGVGMDPERLEELRTGFKESRTSKVGIGLGNIYKRLHMMYRGGELHIASQKGKGTVVEMRIPKSAAHRKEIK